jgi:hypothetical protein
MINFPAIRYNTTDRSYGKITQYTAYVIITTPTVQMAFWTFKQQNIS